MIVKKDMENVYWEIRRRIKRIKKKERIEMMEDEELNSERRNLKIGMEKGGKSER